MVVLGDHKSVPKIQKSVLEILTMFHHAVSWSDCECKIHADTHHFVTLYAVKDIRSCYS